MLNSGAFFNEHLLLSATSSYGRENFEAIEKLTVILHNFPIEMFNPDQWNWNDYIYALRQLEKEFRDVQTANLAAMLESTRDSLEWTHNV